MPVQHEDTCVSGSNPIQCAYYNKDHKIVNMLGYELIEEKVLPAGTTVCSFTGLNGDEDEEYLIEGENIKIVANGADRYVTLQPNGLSTNQSGTRLHFHGSNTGTYALTSLILTQNGWNVDSESNFEAKLKSKSGVIRFFKSESIERISTYDGGNIINCNWSDIVTLITSLVVAISSGGTFSGKIRLFKKIPLDGVV